VNSTKIAVALSNTVPGAASLSASAAHVENAKTVMAPEKMPTIGHESAGTRSPGSGSA